MVVEAATTTVVTAVTTAMRLLRAITRSPTLSSKASSFHSSREGDVEAEEEVEVQHRKAATTVAKPGTCRLSATSHVVIVGKKAMREQRTENDLQHLLPRAACGLLNN